MKRIFNLLLTILPLALSAQNKPDYPQDYFRNPLDIPIFLAGNFGECRPGHFHSGVDIKTLGVENKPVHAAADGYISRIKMEKGGFGHAIYITHDNGYTTLYAHLNDFTPAIQQYVKKEQYEKKHWDVDLEIAPSQFPVKKGQQIAWSGNTGASTAPHLHFEIRNTKTEHPLNPELFGLPIVDRTPPLPAEVVFYKGNIYEEDKLVVSLAKKGDVYKPAKTSDKSFGISHDTVQVYGGITGVGVNVDDYMEGSDNTIAFYTAKLYMDDSIQCQVTLDDIGYDVSRYINAYADYKTREENHKWIQCLFQLPGNRLDGIYTHLDGNKGRLDLSDSKVHKVSIELTDDKDNKRIITFYVSPQPAAGTMPAKSGCIPFYANKTNDFNTDPNVMFSLDGRQLYDDICFHFAAEKDVEAYSDKYTLHYPYVPVHHYFDLLMKPNKTIPFDLRSKVVIMYSDGKDEDGRAAPPTDKGWYKASVRNFGTYWLAIDTVPPVIKSLQKNGSNLGKAKQITFDVKDDITSVRSFSGYLDGKWICFEQHNSLFFYKFDEHCAKGKHHLVFKAEDENGNAATFKMNFTR